MLKTKNIWSDFIIKLFIPDINFALTYKVFLRNLRVFAKTWKANLMFNFLEPLLYLWAMGLGLGVYITKINGLTYLDFLAPGLIASSAMFAVTYEMTYSSYADGQGKNILQHGSDPSQYG